MNADRNLLFGLLALQLNFVDREQLLAAFDRWCLNKTLSLGQIFLQQGVLAQDEHGLLEALVAKHLERHGGSAEKSLAALTPLDSPKEALRRLPDADLQASLAHASAARVDAGLAPTASFLAGVSTSSGARFRILRPHARGGLGEVFVAQDEELRREVALKEILPDQAQDPRARERFLLEAEITGALEHPGIVPVYGLGTYADGRPFYAMRFIKGDSLAEAIKRFHRASLTPAERELELRKLIGRLIDVCNAIEYAHSRGVLHRDLKPGNIMLGKYGETLVVDWGLAKVIGRRDPNRGEDERTVRPAAGSGSAATEIGSAVGTPEFMSPEQAQGRWDILGPASDVYSLGATLYMLLTGRAPFSKDETLAVVARVSRGGFPQPRQLKPDVPSGLEAVCLVAMALDPGKRYQSPRKLADDLEHWLADESISARRDTLSERAARWGRRHRTLTRAVAAALGIISLVSLAAAVFVDHARRDEHVAREAAERSARAERRETLRAEKERQKAEAAEIAAEKAAGQEKAQRIAAERHARIANTLRLASQSRVVGNEHPVRSTLLAMEAVKRSAREDMASLTEARQSLYDALQNLGGRPLTGYSPRGIGAMTPLEFSSDGRWLAASSDDSSVRVWDLRTPGAGAVSIALRKQVGWLDGFAFSPDGRWFAASYFRQLWIWDLRAEQPFAKPQSYLEEDGRIKSLDFSPDGRWLATVVADQSNRTVHVRDLNSEDSEENSFAINSPAANQRWHEAEWTHAFSRDSRWLVCLSGEQGSTLCDLQANRPASNGIVLPRTSESNVEPKFSPDSRWLIASDKGGAVRAWDLTAPEAKARIVEMHDPPGALRALEFSQNGHWLAIARADGVQLYDLTAAAPFVRPRRLDSVAADDHHNSHWLLRFSSDGGWLATAVRKDSSDKESSKNETDDSLETTARLWNLTAADVAAKPAVLETGRNIFGLDRFTFSPDSRWLVTTEALEGALVWNLAAAAPETSAAVLPDQQPMPTILSFSPDSRWLATCGWDGSTQLWDLTAAAPFRDSLVRRGNDERLKRLTFSPDGRWFVTEGAFEARLWNKEAFSSAVNLMWMSFEFCPDGRWFTTLEYEGDAPKTGLYSLRQDAGPTLELTLTGVHLTAFRPDASGLATTNGEEVHWIDLKAKPPQLPGIALRTNLKGIRVLEFSRDGRRLAAAGSQGVSVWDLTALEQPAESIAIASESEPFSLVFSPEGRWLAIRSTASNGAVRLMDLNAKPIGAGRMLEPEISPAATLIFSADDRWLLAAQEREPLLWELRDENQLFPGQKMAERFPTPASFIFSPDGRWLAATGQQGTRLWNLSLSDPFSGASVFERDLQEAAKLVFSPDGRRLVCGSGEPPLKLFDLHGQAPTARPRPIASGSDWFTIYPEAISPDGRWLVADAAVQESVSIQQVTALWNIAVEEGSRAFWLLRPPESAIMMETAFSPDSRWLAAKSEKAISLWDLTTGEPAGSPLMLPNPSGRYAQWEFTPDGRWLAVAHNGFDELLRAVASDETFPPSGPIERDHRIAVRIWPLEQSVLLQIAAQAAGRELTVEECERYAIPDANAYVKRGIEFCELEEWGRAEADFQHAADLDAENASLPLYLKAVTRHAMGDREGFRRLWGELFKRYKNVDNIDVRRCIIDGFISGNPQPEMAAEIFRFAEQSGGDELDKNRLLGGVHFRAGRFEAAVAALSEAARRSPPRAREWLLTAMAEHRCSRAAAAKEAYDTAQSWIEGADRFDRWESWLESFETEMLADEARRALGIAVDEIEP